MSKRKGKPVVAVVGRPNVGKSTLFNMLAGQRISIVKDTPGITRDRIYADVSWLDRSFTLIDTGGIEPDSSDVILSQMREQAEIAINTADVILFMVDVKQGLVDSDAKVADMLRRSRKPVVLVVNKVDNFEKYMADVYEFYNLGIGEPIPISAANQMGIGDMLDEVIKYFDEDSTEEEEDDRIRVAIVGKPNVGKSSLINGLLNRRALARTSSQPGKTQTINFYNVNDNLYFVDLPGYGYAKVSNEIKAKWGKMIERYLHGSKQLRAVFLLIDIRHDPSANDKTMYDWVVHQGFEPIIIATKLDKIKRSQVQKQIKAIKEGLNLLPGTKVIPFSAETKQGRDEIWEVINSLREDKSEEGV